MCKRLSWSDQSARRRQLPRLRGRIRWRGASFCRCRHWPLQYLFATNQCLWWQSYKLLLAAEMSEIAKITRRFHEQRFTVCIKYNGIGFNACCNNGSFLQIRHCPFVSFKSQLPRVVQISLHLANKCVSRKYSLGSKK